MATERYGAIISLDYTGGSDVAKAIADLQKLRQAFGQVQGLATGLSGGPALALGTGAGANSDIVGVQRQFVAALRERADAERAAAIAARGAAALDRVTSRPGATGLEFSATGGVIGVKFNENLRQIETGSRRLAREVDRLTGHLARAQAAFQPPNERQVNAYAANYNRGAIETLVGQYRSDLGGSSLEGSTLVRSSYKVAEELRLSSRASAATPIRTNAPAGSCTGARRTPRC